MSKSGFIISLLFIVTGLTNGFSQMKSVAKTPRVEVYYFHPTDRCPIDQSIEDNTRKMMQSSFAREIKEGTIKFRIINTDDKSQAQTVARFDINAQALYVVKHANGKEQQNDLTHFAFSNGLNNTAKFRAGLKDEIEKALQ
jgi:hypothetical protein